MALRRHELAPNGLEQIDWLGVAIARLGGISKTAQRLGIGRQSIYDWLEDGLAKVSFERAFQLSEASGIPLRQLAERMYPFAPQVPQRTKKRQ